MEIGNWELGIGNWELRVSEFQALPCLPCLSCLPHLTLTEHYWMWGVGAGSPKIWQQHDNLTKPAPAMPQGFLSMSDICKKAELYLIGKQILPL
ncbi:MAG: hypothetical protein F6K47_29605 [Symploca sp. SIO2E6]|nr:hypothetical protein [Symploca sp. SIO2E6]